MVLGGLSSPAPSAPGPVEGVLEELGVLVGFPGEAEGGGHLAVLVAGVFLDEGLGVGQRAVAVAEGDVADAAFADAAGVAEDAGDSVRLDRGVLVVVDAEVLHLLRVGQCALDRQAVRRSRRGGRERQQGPELVGLKLNSSMLI